MTFPLRRSVAAVLLVAGASLLTGCQSAQKGMFSVDVRNQTPQPLWAQIWHTTDRGEFRLASERLGPGDRKGVGPVKGNLGRTFVLFDTMPNPSTPVRVDLGAQNTVLEVDQISDDTDSELIVREVR